MLSLLEIGLSNAAVACVLAVVALLAAESVVVRRCACPVAAGLDQIGDATAGQGILPWPAPTATLSAEAEVAEVTLPASNLVGEELPVPREEPPTEEQPQPGPIWVAEFPRYQGWKSCRAVKPTRSQHKQVAASGRMDSLGSGFWVRWAGSCLLAFEPGAFPVPCVTPGQVGQPCRPVEDWPR